MNLFDSGHNHGGGDARLVDAGSVEPKVLHGICGEDYFGFACIASSIVKHGYVFATAALKNLRGKSVPMHRRQDQG